jgi:hypothetical protein
MSHSKGMKNARTTNEDGPAVSNMIPEEKMRENDLVDIQSHFTLIIQY